MSSYRFKRRTQAEKEKARLEYDDFMEEEWTRTEALMAEAAFEKRLERMKPHEGLKRLRSDLGVTQDEIAAVCGVTKRSYQFYEAGQKAIPSTVVARLSAKYLIDIHGLFSGTAHSDNVHVRAETARLTAEVVMYLSSTFSSMSMEEKQHIAMEFASKNRPTTTVDIDNLFDCIRIVTGDKYLTYEFLNADELDVGSEDLDCDET